MSRQGTLVEGTAVVGHHNKLGCLSQYGVCERYADAVFHHGKGEGSLLHFGWCHLVAAHVYDVVLAAEYVQHAVLVDKSVVVGDEDAARWRLWRWLIARHQRVALTGDAPFGGDDDA